MPACVDADNVHVGNMSRTNMHWMSAKDTVAVFSLVGLAACSMSALGYIQCIFIVYSPSLLDPVPCSVKHNFASNPPMGLYCAGQVHSRCPNRAPL